MYDTTIHAKTISRHFRKSDFLPGPFQASALQKDLTVASAINTSQNGFQAVSLRHGNLSGKAIFEQTSLSEALLIRHVTDNVRRVTGVKQSDRQSIIRCLKALCTEGLAFKIIRFDIHSFYESVQPLLITGMLDKDPAFSRQSVSVLRSFFEDLARQGVSGLPRGLAISATLSEYLLRAFDNEVSAMRGVRFYSRYVDDIILVLSPREQVDEVVSACADLLPQNLQFSRRKSKQYEFQITRGTNPPVPERAIDFLGYCLQVSTTYRSNKILKRDVGLDIAPGKVRKIKQRIARSILEFNCGGRFDDLHDRIRFLTGNYQFYDDNQAQVRFAGLRYNYPLIDAPTSTALRELDAFLHNGLFSAHPKNRLKPILSVAQARLLWGYCFKKGFEANQFFSFSARDIYRITKCWNHA